MTDKTAIEIIQARMDGKTILTIGKNAAINSPKFLLPWRVMPIEDDFDFVHNLYKLQEQ